MAECAYCKTKTELYENGTPVCLECAGAQAGDSPSSAESQIRLMLLQEVRQATDRVTAAAQRFNLIIDDVPGNVPHPDGALRITQASRDLSSARAEMMVAHRRLSEFLSRGVIPQNLKAS